MAVLRAIRKAKPTADFSFQFVSPAVKEKEKQTSKELERLRRELMKMREKMSRLSEEQEKSEQANTKLKSQFEAAEEDI